MTVLPAHRVATPVLERLTGPARGVVLGAGATAAWVDLDGFVVAITTREVPLLPNAVALAAGSGALPGVRSGGVADAAPGRIELGGIQVTWDSAAPPAWDPAVPVPAGASPAALANRAAALLRALAAWSDPEAPASGVVGVDSPEHATRASATVPLRGPRRPRGASAAAPWPPHTLIPLLAAAGLATAADPDGPAALILLFRGVAERDPDLAGLAAGRLLGRGPGLTPEGDDLLAAVAGTLAVLGPVAGLRGPDLTALVAALAPVPGRTNALSTTLLTLAARGLLAEPAGRLLDLGPAGEAAWPTALRRLERLGHGSGRAYAAGIAATANLLA
jgi:hypothetical protein